MAEAASGPHTKELATPRKRATIRIERVEEVGVITRASAKMTTESMSSPKPASARGCIRSVRRPAMGASTIDMSACGASSKAARVGERPRTLWA